MAEKTTKFCVGKDAFERMNYLFQLSNMCATGQIQNSEVAARFYAHQLIAISKKTVQRIEPAIKRKICKSCHQYLVPGKTCKIRVKKKVVIHKCMLCHCEKRFPATPDYLLWNETPEAMGELLDYRNNDTNESQPKTKKIKMADDSNITKQNK